jgi:hypothetical protein
LFTYTGNLTTNALITMGTVPSGYTTSGLTVDYGTGVNSAVILTVMVPEPSSLVLTGFGTVLAVLLLRRQRRR